jgi:hypothetical protein
MKHRWLAPKKTIDAYCAYCNAGKREEVERCISDMRFNVCVFHLYRLGQGKASVKMIHMFCLQCVGGIKAFVRECETEDCLLHPYRMGKNPSRKGIGQDAERMAIIRSKNRP